MQTYMSREKWDSRMKKIGTYGLYRETQFNTNHIYALNSNKLVGLWDEGKNEGVEYSGKGMTFQDQGRRLKKLKTY